MIPEPRFRLIIFGDGDVAEEIDKYPEEDDGIMGWWIIINPSDKLEKKYNLKEKEDENGFVMKWYPEKDIDILNDSVVFGKILIDTTFDGGDNPHNRRNRRLKEQIEGLEEENQILRSRNAYLNEEMRIMARSTDEHIRYSAEMIKTARSAAKKEKEEEEEKETEPLER